MSWPLVKLTEVAEVNPRCPKDIDEDQIVSFVAMASASEEGLLLGEEPKVLKETKKGFTYFERGDVLLAKITPCFENGKSLRPYQIKNQVGFGSTEFHVVRANLDRLDPTYLFYLLWNDAFRFVGTNAMAGAAGQKRVGTPFLKQLEIPLPPLDEQKRIAAILDKSDAIRQKRKQAIDLADEFLRSVFLDMFGDPVTNPKGFPISKLGENCEDLFLGLTSKVDYIDGKDGYPLVRAKDINTGELSFSDVKYISEVQHKKLTKNHLTQKGDLLVSKSGTLGTCAIVRTDKEFSTYESIFTVRPNTSKINIHYLIHLLQNRSFKQKLIGNKVGGTVSHLNLKMFRDFEIGIPPILIQEHFSKKIKKCEMKLDKYRQSNEEANDFFNSLSQKAFSGQL